jgi:hypothetical protein
MERAGASAQRDLTSVLLPRSLLIVLTIELEIVGVSPFKRRGAGFEALRSCFEQGQVMRLSCQNKVVTLSAKSKSPHGMG